MRQHDMSHDILLSVSKTDKADDSWVAGKLNPIANLRSRRKVSCLGLCAGFPCSWRDGILAHHGRGARSAPGEEREHEIFSRKVLRLCRLDRRRAWMAGALWRSNGGTATAMNPKPSKKATASVVVVVANSRDVALTELDATRPACNLPKKFCPISRPEKRLRRRSRPTRTACSTCTASMPTGRPPIRPASIYAKTRSQSRPVNGAPFDGLGADALMALIGDAPDRAAAVVGDEQGAVVGDCDIDRASPDAGSSATKPARSLHIRRRLSIPKDQAHNLVAVRLARFHEPCKATKASPLYSAEIVRPRKT